MFRKSVSDILSTFLDVFFFFCGNLCELFYLTFSVIFFQKKCLENCLGGIYLGFRVGAANSLTSECFSVSAARFGKPFLDFSFYFF